jgi:adenylate kinase
MIIELVRERLTDADTERGYILDGFPRTAVQTAALDQMLLGQTLLAIALIVPEVELERRLDSRRICLNCKAIYDSGTRLGSEEEHCSRCGVTLIRRDDDNLATIKNRLQTYRKITEPILKHYGDQGTLSKVDGTQPPDTIFQTIADLISRTFQV